MAYHASPNDQDYRYSRARLLGAGDIADGEVTTGPTHLDDAVDELVEIVLEKGGEVAFVDEGALTNYGRVALILRY